MTISNFLIRSPIQQTEFQSKLDWTTKLNSCIQYVVVNRNIFLRIIRVLSYRF